MFTPLPFAFYITWMALHGTENDNMVRARVIKAWYNAYFYLRSAFMFAEFDKDWEL